MASISYCLAIGSIMYLAVCTRPDIASFVSSLPRFNFDPGLAHWEVVLHVLRYIRGTLGVGILYKWGASTPLWGYCDDGHLTRPNTNFGLASFAFLFARVAISRGRKLVGNASFSSCESGYMALSMASQEASFLLLSHPNPNSGAHAYSTKFKNSALREGVSTTYLDGRVHSNALDQPNSFVP